VYAFSKTFPGIPIATHLQQDGERIGACKTLLATGYQLEETFHTIAPCPVKREMENRKRKYSSATGGIGSKEDATRKKGVRYGDDPSEVLNDRIH
jgi:hypothetical protein